MSNYNKTDDGHYQLPKLENSEEEKVRPYQIKGCCQGPWPIEAIRKMRDPPKDLQDVSDVE